MLFTQNSCIVSHETLHLNIDQNKNDKNINKVKQTVSHFLYKTRAFASHEMAHLNA